MAPRLPIVLAHGIARFDFLVENLFRSIADVGLTLPFPTDGLQYFRNVGRHLRLLGYEVHHARVSFAAGVDRRASDLKAEVERVLAATGAARVDIIAHSMGGLDARHMIVDHGMADRVRTLATLGTPHHGSPAADWFVAHGLDALGALLSSVVDLGGFGDLTAAACAAFNARAEAAEATNAVRYQAYAAAEPEGRVFAPLRPTWRLIEQREGANDGLASLASQRWVASLGGRKGVEQRAFGVEADHLNEIGWWDPGEWRPTDVFPVLVPEFEGRVLEAYAQMAARLAPPAFAAPAVAGGLESVAGYRPRPAARAPAAEERAALVNAAGPEAFAAPTWRPADLGAAYPDAAFATFGTAPLGGPEAVLGRDDRERVDDAGAPWRRICALRIHTRKGRVYCGTGWFVAPRVLVTAGHCVFMPEEGGEPEAVEVFPALAGEMQPYGRSVARRFASPERWRREAHRASDYGVVLLDDDLGAHLGTWGYTAVGDATLAASWLNVAGYPADRDNATRMYFHARRSSGRIEPSFINYDVDTFGGQSGSPVWINVPQNGATRRYVVGIHTTGSALGNSGVRITEDVYRFIQRWAH